MFTARSLDRITSPTDTEFRPNMASPISNFRPLRRFLIDSAANYTDEILAATMLQD